MRSRPAAAPGKSPWWAACRSCQPGEPVLADREFLGVPSWISRIHAHTDPAHRDPVTVRVVAYQLHGTSRESADYRLVTSLLDARPYPARQLAALYQERWEAEPVFAELKTPQRGARIVLTSKTPDGVLQQIWAYLLVHQALRELMVRTAATRGLDPDLISFTETLRSARRSGTVTPGSFSP
jgi:hypothetical protein